MVSMISLSDRLCATIPTVYVFPDTDELFSKLFLDIGPKNYYCLQKDGREKRRVSNKIRGKINEKLKN